MTCLNRVLSGSEGGKYTGKSASGQRSRTSRTDIFFLCIIAYAYQSGRSRLPGRPM